jgi:malate/lactate dehydrogenase
MVVGKYRRNALAGVLPRAELAVRRRADGKDFRVDAGRRLPHHRTQGATFYAVAAGLLRIVQSILRHQNTVLSVSSLIENYCGISDVCLSLPTVVDQGGIQRVLRLELDENETMKLRHSADVLKKTIGALNLG